MRKLSALSFVLSMLLVVMLPLPAQAAGEQIYSITTDVVLEDDGTAAVTQTWKTHTGSGTEFYIGMTKLGEMAIEDFSVEGPSGKYKVIPEWNEDASFDEKAGKAGIRHIGTGQELCWGKTSYGDNTYVVRWKYQNAVQGYSDFDGFNIMFVNRNLKPAPKSATTSIRLRSGALKSSTTRIWGFGYEGNTEFQDDGTVLAKTSKAMDSDSFMTVLMQFDKGTFSPVLNHRGSFGEVRDRAMERSDYDGGEGGRSSSVPNPFWARLRSILNSEYGQLFVAFVVIAIAFLVVTVRARIKHALAKTRRGAVLPAKRIRRKDCVRKEEWSRDIPLNNSILMIYYADNMTNLPKTDLGSLIIAYLLRWVKLGSLTVIPAAEVENWDSKYKSTKSKLILNSPPEQLDEVESELWQIMQSAMGLNNVCESYTLERNLRQSRRRIKSLERKALSAGSTEFLQLGGVAVKDRKKPWSLRPGLKITPLGRQKVTDCLLLEQYLRRIVAIEGAGVEDVHLWDDYLIIAALIGLGQQVAQEMELLRPDFCFATLCDETEVSNSKSSSYSSVRPSDLFASLDYISSLAISTSGVFNSQSYAYASGTSKPYSSDGYTGQHRR